MTRVVLRPVSVNTIPIDPEQSEDCSTSLSRYLSVPWSYSDQNHNGNMRRQPDSDQKKPESSVSQEINRTGLFKTTSSGARIRYRAETVHSSVLISIGFTALIWTRMYFASMVRTMSIPGKTIPLHTFVWTTSLDGFSSWSRSAKVGNGGYPVITASLADLPDEYWANYLSELPEPTPELLDSYQSLSPTRTFLVPHTADLPAWRRVQTYLLVQMIEYVLRSVRPSPKSSPFIIRKLACAVLYLLPSTARRKYRDDIPQYTRPA